MKSDVATQASALVTSSVLDCLLQCLMNKGILLPTEVNDIFQASSLLLSNKPAGNPELTAAMAVAQDELADRLGLVP